MIVMITAADAKEIVNKSQGILADRINRISDKIIEAATLGKTSIILEYALPNDNYLKVKDNQFRGPEFTAEQQPIVDILKKNGYGVSIKKDIQKRFGLGAPDYDEDDEPVISHHIEVMW